MSFWFDKLTCIGCLGGGGNVLFEDMFSMVVTKISNVVKFKDMRDLCIRNTRGVPK